MSKERDKRYKTVKILIDNGHLKSLLEIFDTLPKSVAARDFGTNYQRFTRLINNVDQFRLKELYTLAALIDVDEAKIIQLAHDQHLSKKAKRKKT